MSPDDAIQQLKKVAAEAVAAVESADTIERLKALEIEHMGRKSSLSRIRGGLGELDEDQRKEIGRAANEATNNIQSAIKARQAVLQSSERLAQLEAERIDVTLPGREPPAGFRNPLTELMDEIIDAFVGLGFSIADGPEVETDYYNFQALNIPLDHPARSMHDTLYLESSGEMPLMRTHTSPVQARVMEKTPPPVYVIVPGRCARQETVDATHLASFHQIEGLAVDYGITFADLRGTLEAFVRTLFGPKQKVRLVPSYFPFTEPSAEVYVLCFACGGSGCKSCAGEGWQELLGAGMVHPNVFKACGYPEDITGFAFGAGLERIAMARYSVPDIRWFFENDLHFLEAF